MIAVCRILGALVGISSGIPDKWDATRANPLRRTLKLKVDAREDIYGTGEMVYPREKRIRRPGSIGKVSPILYLQTIGSHSATQNMFAPTS
jgi:hypothetical protein